MISSERLQPAKTVGVRIPIHYKIKIKGLVLIHQFLLKYGTHQINNNLGSYMYEVLREIIIFGQGDIYSLDKTILLGQVVAAVP